jgi:hypothetical protein
LAIAASIEEAHVAQEVSDIALAIEMSSLDSPSPAVRDSSMLEVDLATTAFEQLDVDASQAAPVELIQDVDASQTAPLELIQDIDVSQAAPIELIQDVIASQLASLEQPHEVVEFETAPLELIQDVEASQAASIEQAQEVVESQPAPLERIQEAVTSQVALREQMKETLVSPTSSITPQIMDEQVVHFNLLEITEVEQVVVEAPIISKVEPAKIRKVWFLGCLF